MGEEETGDIRTLSVISQECFIEITPCLMISVGGVIEIQTAITKDCQ